MGGARERRRREPLGGSGGMLPQKILKSRGLEMLFPAFSKSYLWFTHIANYLLRTLSQQTNAHWEYNTCNVNYKIENRLSLYLETSKCFTFQSHHSRFVVRSITLRMLKNEKKYKCYCFKLNLSRDNILFSTFYTGLFLLFRKKNWGGAVPPPAPPLATALTM